MLAMPLPGFDILPTLAEKREQEEREIRARIAKIEDALRTADLNFLRVSHLSGLEMDEHFSVLVGNEARGSALQNFIEKNVAQMPFLRDLNVDVISLSERALITNWQNSNPAKRLEIAMQYLRESTPFTFSQKFTPDVVARFEAKMVLELPAQIKDGDWHAVKSLLERKLSNLLRESGGSISTPKEKRCPLRGFVKSVMSGGKVYQDRACAAAGDNSFF